MLGKKLAVDLGTSTVRLVVRGEAHVADEPAMVTTSKRGARAAGSAAVRASGGRDAATVVRPLAGAGIADTEALQFLLTQMVNHAIGRQRIFKPDVVAAVHTDCSGVDRRAILDIFAAIGTRTTYLLDAPMAAAMGSGAALSGPQGHLVLDIGGQNIEAAVLAFEGRIAGASAIDGGEVLSAAVAAAASAHLDSPVSGAVAVELIRDVVTALPGRSRSAEVRLDPGEPPVEIDADVFRSVTADFVERVGSLVQQVLAATPTELIDQVRDAGLILTGGGAQLDGLEMRLRAALGIPVHLVAEPHLTGVRGAALAADSLDVLKRNFMYIR